MKIIKIDHLGIAVNTMDEGMKFWQQIIGLEFEGMETIEEQKVKTGFLKAGQSDIELLEATDTDSPVAKHIVKKGEGIHHVALRVENIDKAIKELMDNGIRMIDKKPRKGAGGKKIAFLHPKATGGILVELCE